MTHKHVTKWVKLFKEGRIDPHDEEKSRRPSVISEKLMQQVKGKVCNDRRVTFNTLKESFLHISQSLLAEIISERLDYKKLCIKWMLKMTKKTRTSLKSRFEEKFQEAVVKWLWVRLG